MSSKPRLNAIHGRFGGVGGLLPAYISFDVARTRFADYSRSKNTLATRSPGRSILYAQPPARLPSFGSDAWLRGRQEGYLEDSRPPDSPPSDGPGISSLYSHPHGSLAVRHTSGARHLPYPNPNVLRSSVSF